MIKTNFGIFIFFLIIIKITSISLNKQQSYQKLIVHDNYYQLQFQFDQELHLPVSMGQLVKSHNIDHLILKMGHINPSSMPKLEGNPKQSHMQSLLIAPEINNGISLYLHNKSQINTTNIFINNYFKPISQIFSISRSFQHLIYLNQIQYFFFSNPNDKFCAQHLYNLVEVFLPCKTVSGLGQIINLRNILVDRHFIGVNLQWRLSQENQQKRLSVQRVEQDKQKNHYDQEQQKQMTKQQEQQDKHPQKQKYNSNQDDKESNKQHHQFKVRQQLQKGRIRIKIFVDKQIKQIKGYLRWLSSKRQERRCTLLDRLDIVRKDDQHDKVKCNLSQKFSSFCIMHLSPLLHHASLTSSTSYFQRGYAISWLIIIHSIDQQFPTWQYSICIYEQKQLLQSTQIDIVFPKSKQFSNVIKYKKLIIPYLNHQSHPHHNHPSKYNDSPTTTQRILTYEGISSQDIRK